MAPRDCPSADRLLDFHSGTLADADLDAVADHLERCAACQDAVRKFDEQTDSLLAALRHDQNPLLRCAEPAPRLPGYEILERLGAGGMGVVYKARDLRLGRLVALKFIRSSHRAAARRFRVEAEAIARLQHHNVVQIFEFGEHEGRPYLALELVEGGSLAAWLAGKPQRPATCADLLEVLARAVQQAHERGIVHRDLKPANVLLAGPSPQTPSAPALSHKGGSQAKPDAPARVLLPPLPFVGEGGRGGEGVVPKINDFGLAKILDADGQTQTNDVMGTPSYVAPEQALSSKNVGPAVDLWALGVILYEALTGQTPFPGETGVAVLERVCNHDPVAPRRLVPSIPVDLETICLKCLEKDPAQRYPSASALADELRRFREGQPIKARRLGVAGHVVKWARRRPGLAGLLALLAGVVVVAFALVTWQWREAVGQRADAQLRATKEAEARAEVEREKDKVLVQLHLSSLGRYAFQIAAAQAEIRSGHFVRARKILDDCDARHRGWEHRHLWAACQDRSLDLGQFGGGVFALAFDARSQRLAVGCRDGQVIVWDVQARRVVDKFQGGPGALPVLAIAFSSDGKTLATAGRDGLARIWTVADGKLVRTFAGNGQPWMEARVAFSKDGTRLAVGGIEFASRYSDEFVWDGATGKQLSARRRQRDKPDFVESPDGQTATAEVNAINVRDSKGRQTHTLPAVGVKVSDLTFSRDGKRLAGRASDDSLRVWDFASQKQLASFDLKNLRVAKFVLSDDGDRLIAGALDLGGVVKVWDVKAPGQVLALRGHDAPIVEVAASSDGRWVASSAHQGSVKLWDLRPPRTLSDLQYGGRVAGVAFSPDSGRLASISALGEFRLWDLSRRGPLVVELQKGQQFNPLPHSVAFRPDGKAVATAGPTGVLVREAHLGENRPLFSHNGAATSIAYGPDGKLLAWADKDGRVWLWLPRDGETPRELGDTGATSRVAVSPDGRHLACGCADGKVRVWDLDRDKLAATLSGHRGPVTALTFVPAGRKRLEDLPRSPLLLSTGTVLASASADGTVRLWNVDRGDECLLLQGHAGPVNSLSFTPDGRRLATGGEDQTVQLWDVTTGLPVCVLLGSVRPVAAVAFSPDGQHLASAGADRTIRIWHAPRPAGP